MLPIFVVFPDPAKSPAITHLSCKKTFTPLYGLGISLSSFILYVFKDDFLVATLVYTYPIIQWAIYWSNG